MKSFLEETFQNFRHEIPTTWDRRVFVLIREKMLLLYKTNCIPNFVGYQRAFKKSSRSFQNLQIKMGCTAYPSIPICNPLIEQTKLEGYKKLKKVFINDAKPLSTMPNLSSMMFRIST